MQGRIDPCFHVVYGRFCPCYLNVTAEIETNYIFSVLIVQMYTFGELLADSCGTFCGLLNMNNTKTWIHLPLYQHFRLVVV